MWVSKALADLIRRRVAQPLTGLSDAGQTGGSAIYGVADDLRRDVGQKQGIDGESAQRISEAENGRDLPAVSGESVAALTRQRSAELGLHTPAERAMESSLFIDEPLHELALLRRQANPGTLFGVREWAGYLDARAFARRYGDRELSIPFVNELHGRLAQFSDDPRVGLLEQSQRLGGLPSGLSEREKGIIDDNPFLKLLTPDDFGFLKGNFISYQTATADEAERALTALCDRYNDARLQSGADPYRLAAEVQQDLVSIHPWGDYNGRASRLIMNWILENHGLSPSVIPDFDRDILSTSPEWRDTVRSGSELFEERVERLDRLGSDADPIAVFGLESEYLRYQESGGSMAPLPIGGTQNIAAARAEMDDMRGF